MGYRKNKGFTLLELLIVIGILGILASFTSLTLFSVAKKVKTTKTEVEMRQFSEAIRMIRTGRGLTLTEATGSLSSYDPGCLVIKDFRNVPDSDPCMVAWVDALNKIADANGVPRDMLQKFRRDAWGAPYQLDENEKEAYPDEGRFDLGYICQRHDTIISTGPDGTPMTDDDIFYGIPFVQCPEGLPNYCPDQMPMPLGFSYWTDDPCAP